MKKLLWLFLSLFVMLSCSDNEELSQTELPENDNSAEVEDSVFYQLNVDGYELVAATQDGSVFFLQTDTTFAFSCLFDSCGTNPLVAYCDSTGLVERIVVDKQVVNILYHQDKKKMDIFYKNEDDKIIWIEDVDNPYKNFSSRTESGDVPYSAISIMNDLSYSIYNIINTYDLDIKTDKTKKTIKKFSAPPYPDNVVVEMISKILGDDYGILINNHFQTIATVMLDYSDWVKKELYGDAHFVFRKYAARTRDKKTGIESIALNGYMDGVDSLKSEFKIGVLVAEDGDMVTARHNLDNQSSEYSAQQSQYSFSFSNLETGKKYKFKSYLAPLSTSKYLTGMKCLLDYYQYGSYEEYLYLETKAELKSQEDDHATIELSVENAKTSVKMGIIYSEHSDLLKHEYNKVEYIPTFEDGLFSDNFKKEVELKELKSGHVYYMPYIVYDDDILNRNLDYSISNDIITEKDQIFYGKKDSIYVVKNPVTGGASYKDGKLIFTGYFDPQIDAISEYGICYSKENKELTLENSSILKADKHTEGVFEVFVSGYENVYYRAYIKVDEKVYYGELREIFSIVGKWKMIVGDIDSWIVTLNSDGTYFEQWVDGDYSGSGKGKFSYIEYMRLLIFAPDGSFSTTIWDVLKLTSKECILGYKGEIFIFQKI